MTPVLSIVIPAYNEEDALPHFMARLAQVLQKIGAAYEIIFVDDGSKDGTAALIAKMRETNPSIRLVALSRNFGKEIALTAGLDRAKGQAIAVMDADLQDPPELLEDLYKKWQEGFDVAYAARASRQSDTWCKRMTASIFYRLFNRFADTPIPENAGDYRLMSRRVIDALRQCPERQRFMKGLFAWVGFKQVAVPYVREARVCGSTKWNYWKLWNFALEGLTSFSTAPLRVWSYLGMGIAVISGLYALFLVTRTLIFGVDTPGYASLMVAILFLGGIQLVGLGVLGEYIGRVYHETKARPLYLVREELGE